MARKNIIDSFLNHETKKEGNYSTDGTSFFLHGNPIVRHTENAIEISLCGWNSNTTKRALNDFFGVNVRTVKGKLTLNNEPINSKDWYKV